MRFKSRVYYTTHYERSIPLPPLITEAKMKANCVCKVCGQNLGGIAKEVYNHFVESHPAIHAEVMAAIDLRRYN